MAHSCRNPEEVSHELEDNFEFEKFETKHGPAEQIRIKGHRIASDIIIDEFNQGAIPDQIHKNYPTRTLEEVYATITYYLHNKTSLDAYMAWGRAIEEGFYQEYLQQEPSPVVKRLRALRTQQQAGGQNMP